MLAMLASAGAVGAAVTLGAAAAAGSLGRPTTTVREVAAPALSSVSEPAAFKDAESPLTIHGVYMRDAPGVVQVTATSKALGSGFVLDKAGHIVTNYHVVSGASKVYVSFSNQERLPATIVGRDPSTDLAVLQVRTTSRALTPLPLGNSDLVRVGDSVVAIGNPLGEDR
jgi:S1-C subfamily serine protease